MFNLKREVLLGGVAFFSALLVAGTVLIVNKNEYSNLGFLKTAVTPTINTFKFTSSDGGKTTSSGSFASVDISSGQSATVNWDISNATSASIVCVDLYNKTKQIGDTINGLPVSAAYEKYFTYDAFASQLTFSGNQAGLQCTLKANGSSPTKINTLYFTKATATTPSMTSAIFYHASISPGETSVLSWEVSDADGVYVTCKGSNGTTITGIDDLQIPILTRNSFTTAPYESLIAYGNSITCTFNAYKGTIKSMESINAVLNLTTPAPVISVNGACGSAHNQSFSSAPTTNLCSTGTASSVSGSGPWTWTCSGSNGGTNASCSANKTVTTPTVSASFYDINNQNQISELTVPSQAYMRWSSTNATSVKGYCVGAIPVYSASAPQELGLNNNNYQTVVFDSSKAGQTQTCYFIPYNGSTQGTTVSISLNLKGTPVSPTLKVSFVKSETDKTEIITAKQNETKAVRYQLTGYDKNKYDWFFKFSLPMKINGTTTPAGTWAQMPDETLPAGADMTTSFTFSATTTGDFYTDIKIVAQGAGSSGTAVHSSQSNHVNITASLLGDFDNDGDVDTADLSVLHSNYGKTNVGNVADLNNDSVVNTADLSIFHTNYTGSL